MSDSLFNFSLDQRPKISIAEVIVRKDRGREDFSGVKDLRESITKLGLINAITVEKRSDGRLHLIAGETRLRACALIPEMLGMIPFNTIDQLTEVQRLEIELEENVKRKDLQPLEICSLLEQIDTVKRQLHGSKTRENPTGWDLKQTASLGNVSMPEASKQIKLARKLKERPELVQRIQNLPIHAAIKEVENIEEGERMERLHASGEIQLVSELSNCDALTWLKSQASDSINLILTDPPFGMDDLEARRSEDSSAGESQTYASRMKQDDNLSSSSALKLFAEVIPEFYRVLKPSSHCYFFFELELLGEIKTLFQSAGFIIQWPVLIWDKKRTTTIFRGYNYQSSYEAILYAYKGPDCRRLNDASGSILSFSPLHSGKKIHVFEKPPELLSDLIKRSSTFGDAVADPFAGSGSTLLIAKQLGRRGIGCELDREHFLKAQARLILEPGVAR